MARRASTLAPSALLLLLSFPAGAMDKLGDLQAHFDHETHAGSKVKALAKLSEAQFEAAAKAGEAGDYTAVGLIFEKYRDNVRAAFELLKKQEPDADRHPGSYRQLELEVRRGVREVEETIIIVPDVVRPPLQIVRKDLIDVDDDLIRLLFPRRTKEPMKVPPPSETTP
jgi:hypothetical protein